MVARLQCPQAWLHDDIISPNIHVCACTTIYHKFKNNNLVLLPVQHFMATSLFKSVLFLSLPKFSNQTMLNSMGGPAMRTVMDIHNATLLSNLFSKRQEKQSSLKLISFSSIVEQSQKYFIFKEFLGIFQVFQKSENRQCF